ncbi:MAG: aldehyde dehydrogenase [Chloroflexia bacterium]|jgi:aldehyde dehydrogenase (NAD+)|nr:aldehyde dehydrogenase [Chloroflexia bacterium]
MATVAEIFETLDYGPAPEAKEPALQWIERHQPFGLFIDGEWVAPGSGKYFDSQNPATSKPLAKVALGTVEDVDKAVAAARRAFESWSTSPGHVRARYMYAIARLLQKHSRLLAVLESLDNGKTIRETRDIDIPLVARHFYYHAGWAQLMETEMPGMVPVGVVGQIIPWNFPLLMMAWKIAPAIAMGNTVVLKPASYTPLTALAFAHICDEAGLPKGVVNIVTGEARTAGEAILTHPGVDKIAFTGSTDIGRHIRQVTAGSGKKLSLELGGKSPFIVFDDADLDSVVEGVVDAIWFNQGQVCCAGSRLLAQEGIAKRLEEKLRYRMERLRIGDPLDKAMDIGAIVGPTQLQQIQKLVQQGVDEGAYMWQPSWSCPTEGSFFPPTLFTNVSPSSTIAQTEIFGPVLVSMTFRTPSEAVALANNTRYGLAASVWSENINLALDVAAKVKAGTVWINCTNQFDAASGFGGYRESGYGREGGREGLYEYVRPVWEAAFSGGRNGAAHPSEMVEHIVSEEPHTNGGNGHHGNGHHGNGHHEEDLDDFSTSISSLIPAIDRTPKMFIGGKQARPDSGYSAAVYGPDDELIGEIGQGNRKDIRNAVEAAHAAEGWASTTGHNKAQILYYIAENLSARAGEFAGRIQQQTGGRAEDAQREVELSIERLFTYAAWADKYDGLVHRTPSRNITIAMPEPIGVMGIACPTEYPLLGLVSLVAPAIAMGNTVVVVPSERHPLSATDFYQVLETSDVPGGVVNIVTGPRETLTKVLAEHDDVDAMWYFGTAEGSKLVENSSAGNMKRTWVNYGHGRDWLSREQGEGQEFLREATQVKNVWTPYGE